MGTIQRERGRFVSTSGLRKLAAPSGSVYDCVICDESGRPVSHLMEWYRRRKAPGSDRTRNTYLDMLLPFEGWRRRDGLPWNAPPADVRAQFVGFLRERLACALIPDRERDGYVVKTSRDTPLRPSSIRVLFAATRDLYDVLGDLGLYAYPNPMVSQTLLHWKRQYLRHAANVGAPDVAGIRGETHHDSRRSPTSFFRLASTIWTPAFPMEPDDVQRRLYDALIHMIRKRRGVAQRDRAILILLLLTGARLHEIVGMTIGGYARADDPGRAYITNKGSNGREVKLVHFGPWAERELVAYIRGERADHDPLGRGRRWPQDRHAFVATDPLFLTARGGAYTSDAFRFHWRILRTRVQQELGIPFRFRIHDIRHLVVTEWRRRNKEEADGDEATLRRLNQGLQGRVMWHSPETVARYDHSENMKDAFAQMARWFADVQRAVNEPRGGSAAPIPEVGGDVPVEEIRLDGDYTTLWREE